MAADPESCQLQLRRIRENGYSIWLDDFESGYSSFNMFSKFRFELIKYDMEMIRNLDDNLFRIRNGDTIKPCETPEEREEMNRKWLA